MDLDNENDVENEMLTDLSDEPTTQTNQTTQKIKTKLLHKVTPKKTSDPRIVQSFLRQTLHHIYSFDISRLKNYN